MYLAQRVLLKAAIARRLVFTAARRVTKHSFNGDNIDARDEARYFTEEYRRYEARAIRLLMSCSSFRLNI